MVEMVEKKVWLAAQAAERKQHTYSYEEGFPHYMDSYRQYFDFTGASFTSRGKVIIEIGPADFPALRYCAGYRKGIIIEPMPSAILQEWAQSASAIELLTQPAEELYIDMTGMENSHVEVWLFNVLQHVICPELIVEKCKNIADTIRFFEPINCGTDECHLWDLTLEMFQHWFGRASHYPPNPRAQNFHTHECAYGIWRKTEYK